MNDQYLVYKTYVLKQHELAENFDTYQQVSDSNLMVGWSEADFNRYKHKEILPEHEYFSLLSLKTRISEEVISKVKF